MKTFFPQRRLIPALICAILSFHFSLAQYSTQGPLNGSTFSDDNSIGNFPFNIPGNADVSDNNRSSASALLTLVNGDTHYLKATVFGFSIPALAAITGIRVDVEKNALDINAFATVRDNEIKLVKGNIPVGNNKALGASWTGTDNYSSYGDTTDTWGTTWSPAEVNASDFGVVFSAEIDGLIALLPSARIDHIRITVFYITTLPIHFLSFAADAKKENEVLLTWTTCDNDERVVFTGQRSLDGSRWTDLCNIPGFLVSVQKYQYTDHINVSNGADRFYYRVKMTLISGAALHTRIAFVEIGGRDVFNLYPNPCRNEVFVCCTQSDQVTVFSVNGQKMKVDLEKISNDQIKINTASLKPGFI